MARIGESPRNVCDPLSDLIITSCTSDHLRAKNDLDATRIYVPGGALAGSTAFRRQDITCGYDRQVLGLCQTAIFNGPFWAILRLRRPVI